MRLSLPDMSGPPVWWDVLVLGFAAAVVGSALRHRYGRPARSIPQTHP